MIKKFPSFHKVGKGNIAQHEAVGLLQIQEGRLTVSMQKMASVAIIALVLGGGMNNAAEAGGLFGKGGLIRGSVGNFLDKHVEKPILTPAARGAAVAGGAALGAAGALAVGAPPNAGAAVGAAVGHAVNEAAAGKSPFKKKK